MTKQIVLTAIAGRHVSTLRGRVLPLVCAAFVTIVSGCHSAPPPSPSPTQMAHCAHVYGVWLRYLQAFVDHSGERAQAERMMHDCQNSRYDTEALEAIMRGRGVSPQLIAGSAPILPP